MSGSRTTGNHDGWLVETRDWCPPVFRWWRTHVPRLAAHIGHTAVADVLQISRTRILKFLIRRGVVDVADDIVTVTDDLADRDPVLAALASASVLGLPPAGPARRKPMLVAARGHGGHAEPTIKSALCVDHAGFGLHAATTARADDTRGRQVLVKYVLRPPLANERLQMTPDGNVRLLLKKAFRDGTATIEMQPCAPPRTVGHRKGAGERLPFNVNLTRVHVGRNQAQRSGGCDGDLQRLPADVWIGQRTRGAAARLREQGFQPRHRNRTSAPELVEARALPDAGTSAWHRIVRTRTDGTSSRAWAFCRSVLIARFPLFQDSDMQASQVSPRTARIVTQLVGGWGGCGIGGIGIRRIIGRHLNEVKYCYEQKLTTKPELGGRIMVQFTIGASGEVIASILQDSTMGNAAVDNCTVNAVRSWQFPKPCGGGTVVVSYPFVLTPGRN